MDDIRNENKMLTLMSSLAISLSLTLITNESLSSDEMFFYYYHYHLPLDNVYTHKDFYQLFTFIVAVRAEIYLSLRFKIKMLKWSK